MNKLILGTVQFGTHYGINNQSGKPPQNEVTKILNLAQSHGIHLLDTAEGYGDSQKILGNYFRQHPGHSFQVLTKFSAHASLADQLKKTLEELSLPSVNTYSFHRFEDLNKVDLTKELEILKAKGLTKKIGVSIYDNQEFKSAINHSLIDVIQLPFNLFDNWSQRGELAQTAVAQGKELHVRSIFLQGLFFKDPGKLPIYFAELEAPLRMVADIARKHDVTTGAMALQYALQFKEFSHVLIGVETLDQLKNNIEILNTTVPREAFDEISKIKIIHQNLLDPRTWKMN